MVPWNAKKSNEGSLEALRNLANDQERTLIILPKSSPNIILNMVENVQIRVVSNGMNPQVKSTSQFQGFLRDTINAKQKLQPFFDRNRKDASSL